MSLHEQIKEEIKEAMKAKEALRLEVVRGILAALTNESVAKGGTPQDLLDDEAALSVIKRLAKQRKDSAAQFESGGRSDLAKKEKEELEYIEKYLPQMMGRDEIEKVVKAKKEELGILDKAKIGVLIGASMKELAGKADGGDVKAVAEGLF